ncbi:sensor histidine kinase [Mucilaginibacter psychrotolerans]|nr:histidine kinase [Mucilaginibacter psychrotolerans]
MTKKRLILYYLAGWLCLTLYLYIDNVANKRGAQPYVWSNLVSVFMAFTFCFFAVYPFFLKRKKIPLLLAGLVIAEVLFVACRYLIEEVLYLWFLGYDNYDDSVSAIRYFNDNWWRALQPILFSFIAWALLDTFKKEREAEQLKKENIQAELLFLKTQINPHFLYNTLNYLYSLAYPVSDVLGQAIIKLSQLMRYMLHNSPDGMIGLQLEIDYLHNYIEIYKLRFEDHFFVDFSITGASEGKRIASLILIPFVENAFKHGVVDDSSRPIQIRIDVKGDELYFSSSNAINHGAKDSSSGIGLANIRRRLQLIYPETHQLLTAAEGDTYTTTLKIHLK